MERRFRYLADPLFLGAVGLYALNRLAIKPLVGTTGAGAFFHSWANDILCIPFWLPPSLWLARRLGIRRHDAMPSGGEVATMLVVWSIVFEFLAPHLPACQWCVADPRDILCYALGGLVALSIWRTYLMR